MSQTDRGSSQVLPITCPKCGHLYKTQVCQLVMPGSRKFEELQRAELNNTICPNCENSGILPVPFLLYQPEKSRVVCFIPLLDQITEEKMMKIIQLLLLNLRHSLGSVSLQESGLKELEKTDDYNKMVALANGALEEGESPDPLASLLQQLINGNAVERAILMAENRDSIPELKELVDALLSQKPWVDNPTLLERLTRIKGEIDATVI